MPRATKVIVIASVVGGVFVLCLAAWKQSVSAPVSRDAWVVASAIGALILASRVRPVVVFRGGESATFQVDESFFVVLALLTPPLITLGAFAAATASAHAIRRRSLTKSAFNVGQVLIAAGLGLAVSRAVAVPSDPITAGQIGAAALGVATYSVINTLLVGGVVISMGTSWRELTNDLSLQALLFAGGALVGVILALAIQAHLWAAALAVVALALERWLISARFGAIYGRARMERLYEVTLEANRGLRQQAVLDTIVAATSRLLRSPQATVAASEPSPGELAAPMTVAGQERWLVAAGRRKDEPFDDSVPLDRDGALVARVAEAGRQMAIRGEPGNRGA